MKRIIAIVLVFSMIFSITAFADEEYSSNANMDYDYNESYDENKEKEEKTDNKYDDIDVTYEEKENEEYYTNEDAVEEPIVEYEKETPNGITVYLNDEKVDFDVAPMLINNRTMVPVRAIFEALGATVTWDNDTQTAKGVLDGIVVEIAIGSMYLLKNGKAIELDSPAVIVSGRTLVPARAIAESYDCFVDWHGETQVVEIISY